MYINIFMFLYKHVTFESSHPNVCYITVSLTLLYYSIIVYMLTTTINNMIHRTISNYLLWRFVRHRVNNLDDRFQDGKQKFYYILFGREKSPPRWKNCVAQVNSNLGMAMGAMFVQKYFDENSKNDVSKF